jgi:hypothetical protein
MSGPGRFVGKGATSEAAELQLGPEARFWRGLRLLQLRLEAVVLLLEWHLGARA